MAKVELRREISERQRAEETLRLSERNLRRLTESIPQMLWSATPDGYVNRAVPDEELDAFVDALAERIASFNRQAIAATKRLVDVASLPPDSEIAAEWDAFIASLGRPAAKSWIGMLMERGFHKPGDVERRLGYHVGQLGG